MEDEMIVASVAGETGEIVKIQFCVVASGEGSLVAVKRVKGHGLDYMKLFETICPLMRTLCA